MRRLLLVILIGCGFNKAQDAVPGQADGRVERVFVTTIGPGPGQRSAFYIDVPPAPGAASPNPVFSPCADAAPCNRLDPWTFAFLGGRLYMTAANSFSGASLDVADALAVWPGDHFQDTHRYNRAIAFAYNEQSQTFFSADLPANCGPNDGGGPSCTGGGVFRGPLNAPTVRLDTPSDGGLRMPILGVDPEQDRLFVIQGRGVQVYAGASATESVGPTDTLFPCGYEIGYSAIPYASDLLVGGGRLWVSCSDHVLVAYELADLAWPWPRRLGPPLRFSFGKDIVALELRADRLFVGFADEIVVFPSASVMTSGSTGTRIPIAGALSSPVNVQISAPLLRVASIHYSESTDRLYVGEVSQLEMIVDPLHQAQSRLFPVGTATSGYETPFIASVAVIAH